MKVIATILAGIALTASLLFTGCATTPQTTLTRITTASKLAAYVGTSEYLRAHPETQVAFEQASSSLGVIAASEHVDLVTLLAVVNSLPVKELKTDRAKLIVTAATLLLSDYAGSLPLEQLDNLKPVAQAIKEGIDLALAGVPKSAAIQMRPFYGCTVANCKEHGTTTGYSIETLPNIDDAFVKRSSTPVTADVFLTADEQSLAFPRGN